jgi:hypothetical protein
MILFIFAVADSKKLSESRVIKRLTIAGMETHHRLSTHRLIIDIISE